MGNILVIVDVQKQFKKFMQHDLVDELSKYAESFDKVYQIWDTHNNAVGPSYSFPGQVDSIPKKFGKNNFSESVKKYIKEIEHGTENGKVFSLKNDDGYIIRVKNNHGWFYINPEIIKLINEIKNDKITLVGGADNECLQDVHQSFISFGLNVSLNDKYIYDAKTSHKNSIHENFKIIKFKDYKK